ncbi:MAG TPA: ROK family protein [Polyangiaceae bacterium]|nr:ROK family protein [Polyangiaceae bacterium]
MTEALSLGVDLGGTKVEAVLLRRTPAGPGFEILTRERVATGSERGYEAILTTTAELVRNVARSSGRPLLELAVGVGMPGSVSRTTGLVKNSNTVCLNGRPFREDLSRALGCPVAFENDANCFALAEAYLGAGRAHRKGIVFGVILGSGVGGGIVIDGRVWPGPQNLAGEWGHHAVGPWARVEMLAGAAPSAAGFAACGLSPRARCYCGKMGCLELYASGVNVEREYERRTGRRRILKELVASRIDDVDAASVVDEMIEAIGRGLANVIDILDPSAIVLGGGVSNLDILYGEGVARVARYLFNDELRTPILKHELGDSAGVLGAALLHTDEYTHASE